MIGAKYRENGTRRMNNNLMSSGSAKMRHRFKIARVITNTQHNQIRTAFLGCFDDLFGWFAVFHDRLRTTPESRSLRNHFVQFMDRSAADVPTLPCPAGCGPSMTCRSTSWPWFSCASETA